MLAQDYPSFECIVVDDGSTDNTPEVLAKFSSNPKVKLVRQANAGQTVAKNQGIKLARGEFIAFCDADDTWRADKLSRQVPCFSLDKKIAVVYSDLYRVDKEGKKLEMPEPKRYSGRITETLLLDNYIPFVTTIVRKDILDEFGGFDEKLTMSIDYDLWLRISVNYLFYHVPEPLANYRIWEGQMSKKTGERLDNFFALLEAFFEKNPDCVSRKAKDRAWAHSLVTRGMWHASEGRTTMALKDYFSALQLHIFDVRLWRGLAALAIGKKLM